MTQRNLKKKVEKIETQICLVHFFICVGIVNVRIVNTGFVINDDYCCYDNDSSCCYLLGVC